MGTTSNDIQLLLSNVARPADRGAELHRVRWFIDHGIRTVFECLHPPVPIPGICDKVNFEAIGADELIESYDGDETPLRDGIIKSRWARTGTDAEGISWAYDDTPSVQAAAPEVPPRSMGGTPVVLSGTSIRTRPPQHHDVRWYICAGVAEARLTCLHDQAQHCDKTEFTEDALLPFTHKGGRTVLRDGIIESWWTVSYWGEYDLLWDYTDTAAAAGDGA